MDRFSKSFSRRPYPKSRAGFTLIELAVVLVIVGIVISVVATVLPSLIQSAKIKKAQAILEKIDYAVEGYTLANHRLPFADSDGDGRENAGAFLGDVPYLTLGISSAGDAWGNAIKYGVYPTLTATFADAGAFCDAISAASTAAFDKSKVYVTGADHLSGSDSSNSANQAYALASGGQKDLDGSNGFFDLGNGESKAGNPGFNAPNRIQSTSYDDLTRALSLNELNRRNCTGSGGSGGGVTSPGLENTDALCGDGLDNDGDGFIDCYDQDCCGAGLTVCPQCPPSTNVQINTSPMPNGTVGESYTHTFPASGGSGYYYWYLDGLTPNIPGLTISLWNGTLSGTIDNCAGSYTVDVRVEDRYDSSKTDTQTFTLSVANGSLTVTPSPNGGGAGNPDFVVDGSNFSRIFTANGGHVGDFNWKINWKGGDPGGFQITKQSATESELSKNGATTSGNFTFSLTATDGNCPSNAFTTNSYSITITTAGAVGPYNKSLDAEWRLDECAWDGSAAEVKDSGPNLLDGKSVHGARTLGTGKTCRAGYFDGRNDYLDMGDILNDRFGPSSSTFTITVWLYPTELHSARTDHRTRNCFFAKASDSHHDNLEIGVNTDGTLHLFLDTRGENAYDDFGSRRDIALNAWNSVAVSYDNGTVSVIINGKKYENTSTWKNGGSIDSAAKSPVTIGSSQHVNTYFTGKIDEVKIFSKALTPKETGEVFDLTRDCSGACYSPAIAEYAMDEGSWTTNQADGVRDSSGNGHHGTARGSASIDAADSHLCKAGRFRNGNSAVEVSGLDELGTSRRDQTTVTFWMKWLGGNSEMPVGWDRYDLFFHDDRFGFNTGVWDIYGIRQARAKLAGGWHHIAAIFTNRETTHNSLFIDGEEQAIDRVLGRSRDESVGEDFRISGWAYNSKYRFDGLLDEVRIYARSLAENEIKADMERTRTCP